jgi:lipopolysaccharide export system permease protein
LDGDLTIDTLGTVLLLGVIRYLVILLPFSFFMAIIMVLSRMYKDSEMTAMIAGGGSPFILLRSVFIVGLPLILILYFLVAQVSPWATRLAEVIENVTEQSLILTQITPGKFFEIEHAGWVLYAESKDPETQDLKNIFIQRSQGDKISIEVAKFAHVEEENGFVNVFVLRDGRRIEGVPGQGEFLLSSYEEHRVFPPRADFSKEGSKPKYQPMEKLFGSSDTAYIAELHQRLSIVFSTFVLMLLAIPISKVAPESGRFSRLAIGAAVYIVYLNLVVVSCSLTKRGEFEGVVALLLTHVIALVMSIYLFKRSLVLRS